VAERLITNDELLADLREGLTTREIMAKRDLSKSTVNGRRQRLRFKATTLMVMAKPEVQKMVAAELDTIALLQVCMQRLVMLSDAYHEWLLDPQDRGRYMIGPRATEIEVVYMEPGDRVSKKATLQELLNRIEAHVDVQTVERKSADPRTELRATVATISSTVAQMVDLVAMLADARAMQVLRDLILEELRRVDEDVAARIVTALRSRLVVGGVPVGTRTVDAADGGR
jgi:hypothetical protein